MKNFISRSVEDTKRLAVIIAKILKRGDTLFLRGDLGAGKTTFAQSLISALLVDFDDEVTSPTFGIMNLYSNDGISVAHMDLYRLRSANDLIETGVMDAIGVHISVVEWPDLLDGLVGDHFEIYIRLINEDFSREFSFDDRLAELIDKNYEPF